MSTLNLSGLWIEKYRPHTIDDIALKPAIKQLILDYAKKEEIPNLLFVGNTGIGKTSFARIIIRDILQCQSLYINASDENGIDTVRGKITSFAQTKSIDGKIKVVLLDEVDGFSDSGQNALRNLMEEYSRHTRFIFTANRLHKINTAIQSRCQSIAIETSVSDITKRCVDILRAEGIKFTPDQTIQLIELVRSLFPDVRRTINALQRMCASGSLHIAESVNDKISGELLKMLRSKESCENIRQFIINKEDEFSRDYPAMLKNLLNEVYESSMDEKVKQLIICIIAEHMYRSSFVMDQEINAFHCMLTILGSIT